MTGSDTDACSACQCHGLTEEAVREALAHDHGPDALLLSWTCHDFTNKGDNYLTLITSISVRFAAAGGQQEVSYVVKQKQEKGKRSDFDDMVFLKEGKFYTELVPLINTELRNAGMPPFKVPRCLNPTWHGSGNEIFLENLTCLGYRLFDRKKAPDTEHTHLILQELSRMHAASFLLLSKLPLKDHLRKFQFLSRNMVEYSDATRKAFNLLICGGIQTAAELARAVDRNDMKEWFESLAPRGVEILEQQMASSPPFDVIVHGDCWVNNFLFRYDAKGQPVEVRLLDFQLCRKASLAVDLNYFLFTCLPYSVRRTRLRSLLTAYHKSFTSVVEAAGVTVPFTLLELTQEYYRKNMLGLIYGALSIPGMVCDPEDAQKMNITSEGQTLDYVTKKRHCVLRMLKTNPLLRSRLDSLYQDIQFYGCNT